MRTTSYRLLQASETPPTLNTSAYYDIDVVIAGQLANSPHISL